MNISLVFVSHQLSKSWQNSVFLMALVHNLSGSFITCPTHTSTKHIWDVLQSVIDIDKKKVSEIMTISQSLGPYPYFFVSSKVLKNDVYSRFQFQLFSDSGDYKERLILFSKSGD